MRRNAFTAIAIEKHEKKKRLRFNRPPVSPKERFFRFVDKTQGEEGCWLWTGNKNTVGGSLFAIRPGVGITPRRFSWWIENGSLTIGKAIFSVCGDRDCVNPRHLRVGKRSSHGAPGLTTKILMEGGVS